LDRFLLGPFHFLPRTRWSKLILDFSTTLAVADAGGAFRFDALLPGRYTIRPVGNQSVPFFAEPTEAHCSTNRLQAGGKI
jgi:hypothetical protein